MSFPIVEIITWILGVVFILWGLRLSGKHFVFVAHRRRQREADTRNLTQKLAYLQQEKVRMEQENEDLTDKAEYIVKLFETAKNIGGTLDFENIYKIIGFPIFWIGFLVKVNTTLLFKVFKGLLLFYFIF